jgi:hypothetical protein
MLKFKYWFLETKRNDDVVCYDAYDIALGRRVGTIEDPKSSNKSTSCFVAEGSAAEVGEAFDAMFNEDLFLVNLLYDNKLTKSAENYNAILTWSRCEAAARHAIESGSNLQAALEDAFNRSSYAVNWLSTTDFYEAPASTIYHESEVGGLLKHTLVTAYHAATLSSLPVFEKANPEDATFVALVHDWCKIGYYESYQKNVKNETTGQWEKQTAFKRRDLSYSCLGHGVSSMYMAQKFFKLSIDECCAIRWHMSAWRVVDSEMNELQQANEAYPLVHLLQFADQLSLVKY